MRSYLSGEDNFQLPASRTLLLQLHPMLPLRRECYYKLIEANEPISSFQIIATSLAAKALTGHPQESSSISSCPNWMKQSSNMCQNRMGWNPFHPSFASKTSTLVIFATLEPTLLYSTTNGLGIELIFSRPPRSGFDHL